MRMLYNLGLRKYCLAGRWEDLQEYRLQDDEDCFFYRNIVLQDNMNVFSTENIVFQDDEK